MSFVSRNTVLFILLGLLACSAIGSEALHWHVLHSLTPGYPEDPDDRFLAAHETTSRLSASWGERESLVLFVRADENLNALKLIPETFLKVSGVSLDPASLRLRWLNAKGDPGDSTAHPIDLPKGRGRWARLDFFAPVDADAGTYTGLLRATHAGGRERIAIELEIWAFDQPRNSPLALLESGEAPLLEDILFARELKTRARVTAQPTGDLPGPGAGALAERVLPTAAWRSGIRQLIVEDASPSFLMQFEDGLADLAVYLDLREDPALLAERIASVMPIRGLCDWQTDPQGLLHWRLAAGAYLTGEEGIALQLVREMESLREGPRGQIRPLADPEGPAWGWKGARKTEVLEDGGLRLMLDADHPAARFTPRERDWRRDGSLEATLLAESEPLILDLTLEQGGFRKRTWTYRLHLPAGETRKLSLPLPREKLDLGKVHILEFRSVDPASASFVLRDIRLR